MTSSRLRVAYFSTVRLNPYVDLLAAGVQAAAPDIGVERFDRLGLRWTLAQSSITRRSSTRRSSTGRSEASSDAELATAATQGDLEVVPSSEPSTNAATDNRMIACGEAHSFIRVPFVDGSGSRTLREPRRYAIMHLHWAELQIQAGSRRGRLIRCASFLSALALAKLRGIRVVYTVHNLAQHEGRHERLNRLAHAALFAWADALHVHDASVAEALRRQTGRTRGVYVIPHGSYVGCYPDAVTPADARSQLGLAEGDFVYLALGGLRPYKGIEELIEAFCSLPGADLRLVIAGHPHEPAYAAELRRRIAGDRRIVAHLEHVPDERLQLYMRAADVCVFPYRQVTTSGAAVLALSFGRPILAPASGPFPELAGQTGGLTYDAGDPGGLRLALLAALALDLPAAGAAIAAYLDRIAWPKIGAQHAAVYRSLVDAP